MAQCSDCQDKTLAAEQISILHLEPRNPDTLQKLTQWSKVTMEM